jgi:hypothetical protein
MGRLLYTLSEKRMRKGCVVPDKNEGRYSFYCRPIKTPLREIELRLVGADQPYRQGGPSGYGCECTEIGRGLFEENKSRLELLTNLKT